MNEKTSRGISHPHLCGTVCAGQRGDRHRSAPAVHSALPKLCTRSRVSSTARGQVIPRRRRRLWIGPCRGMARCAYGPPRRIASAGVVAGLGRRDVGGGS